MNRKTLKKSLSLVILILMIAALSSCVANKKLKKKCRECPEFSYHVVHVYD